MIRKLLTIVFTLAITLTVSNLSILAHEGEHHAKAGTVTKDVKKQKVQCPVTKNWFVPDEKTDKVVYKGKTYYFCCPACKPKFLANPEKYVKG